MPGVRSEKWVTNFIIQRQEAGDTQNLLEVRDETKSIISGLDSAGRVMIFNQATTPATPTNGGILFVQSGTLKYKGSLGTVTTIANA